MLKSMTAFSRLSVPAKQGGWTVEIRSLNHRFFEFSLKAPQDLHGFEDQIKELIHSKVKRGKVAVSISQDKEETAAAQNLTFDEKVIRHYLSEIKKIKKKFHLEGEMSVNDLARLPGVLTVEPVKESPEKKWPFLRKAVLKNLDQLIRMKAGEGQRIGQDIDDRLNQIAQAVQKVEKSTGHRSSEYFEKLKARLHQLLDEKREDDEERILREVAFLAEKNDITEEMVRLRSHITLFKDRMKSNEEIGRELDFLCQEMHREINTMGSKASFFEISKEVVFVKGELEKIREQIQNIE